jgi:uncharacterized protein YndB with AHSA1/START domain
MRGASLLRLSRPWNIALTVSINAERHRLFQALTLPEYIEAWMRIPGPHGDEQITVTCTEDSYRILACRADGLETCIAGAYRVSRRSKMVFTWKKGTSPTACFSLVTIRLLGDFARTTLSLVHSGLVSKTEYVWHRAFWEGSIGRLHSLFGSAQGRRSTAAL